MSDTLRQFVGGAPLSMLDEEALRSETSRLVSAFEVATRRHARIANALEQIADACDELITDALSRPDNEADRGRAEMANNVASAAGHARSWAMRSTREVE